MNGILRQARRSRAEDDVVDNLGVLYLYGKGVPENLPEAILWFRKAADQNYASAQDHLGNLYVEGKGVPLDYSKALEFYHQAVVQNYAASETTLG